MSGNMGIQYKRKLYKILAWVVLALSVYVMIVIGSRLWEIRSNYRVGDRSYRELASLVRPAVFPLIETALAAEGNLPEGRESVTAVEEGFFYSQVDFAILKAINPAVTAWLYSPDTVIDYPIMQAQDYDYYLHRLPDGTYNSNGSLFLDYNSAPDFSGLLTVIYGHKMKSGRMFGSLTNYKRQAYFNKHPYMYIYTENRNYRLDLLYGCVIAAGEWRERAFMYEANTEQLLTYAAYHSTFRSEASYIAGDHIIALSTCSNEFDGARYIVIGVLHLLTVYNEQGESKTVEFTVREDRGDMPQPGAYLQVNASKQIVLSWRKIEESSIPKKVIESIKAY